MKHLHNTLNRETTMKCLLIALTIPFLLVGCNTMEGAGTDIKHAGQSLENAAENSKSPPCSQPPCPRTQSRTAR
jgi:predicted small secreted protein